MADPRERPRRNDRSAKSAKSAKSARSPRARQQAADPARTAALETVRAVWEDDAYGNLALAASIRAHALNPRDAALATELASGTLRRQGTYDAVIAACAGRPIDAMDPPVRAVLRLGAHQLLATRVPSHAAVSTSVDLVRTTVGPRAVGFVNAVLRRVSERTLIEWVRTIGPDPAADPVGFAALAQSHPRWVVLALQQALGAESDEIDEALAADNIPPGVTLVARPGVCSRDELLTGASTPTAHSPYGVHLAEGDPGRLPAVTQGRAGVQDEGSQLVALALADAELDGPDERWLDLCAGPGGKAALLGGLAAMRGAGVLAVEKQPHRADLVRSAVAALPDGAVTVVAGDSTEPTWPAESFDRVLVDAPCSGLGALRRRPEARWRRTEADLADLVPLQQALLEAAISAVRPGGLVAYVTCSPVLAETAEVVSAALSAHPELEVLDAERALSGVADCTGPLPGTVQLWPHRHGTDAMFLALMRRRA